VEREATSTVRRTVRICVLARQFPVVSQTFVVDHAAGLAARGHDVVVVPLLPPPADEPVSEETQAAVRRLTAPPRSPTGGRARRAISAARIAAESAVGDHARSLRFALQRDDFPMRSIGPRLVCARRIAAFAPFDVLHAQFGPTGLAALLLRDAGVFDAPIVVSFHGYDAKVIPAQVPRCYDPLIGAVARVTAGSAYMRDVVERLGFSHDQVAVWPQGVDTARFAPARGDTDEQHHGFHVLTVARLVDFKGVDVALRAVALARPRIAGLRYTVVGDGERRAELESLAKQLGVDDITTFRGALAHDDVVAAHAAADAFLITGRVDRAGHVEGQGVAPLEASASELPVVATRSGGLTEVVVDGETGLLVEPENPEAAADALVRLATDAALRARLGAAGRAHVQRAFSQEHSLDVIEQVYRDVRA
jgi:colanic acid/amylovoran biosynthesis glycosyltransferase